MVSGDAAARPAAPAAVAGGSGEVPPPDAVDPVTLVAPKEQAGEAADQAPLQQVAPKASAQQGGAVEDGKQLAAGASGQPTPEDLAKKQLAALRQVIVSFRSCRAMQGREEARDI